MSHSKLSSKRRTHAVIAATATLGLLGATPALAAQSAGASLTRVAGSTSHPQTQVPANVRLYQTRTSLLGVHKWYQQISNGHPVVGGWYAQHITEHTGGGSTVSVWDGRVTIQPLADTTVSVSAAAATTSALHAAKAPTSATGQPDLWVLPGTANGARLVWAVDAANGRGATTTYVDAQTGAVLKTVVTSKRETPTQPTYVTGRARVFDPNPVVKLQDENLKDHGDANSAVPIAGYTTVSLNHLNGSHTLVGEWVRITNSNLAGSPDNRYFYLRANDKFEQVNAYQAVDVEQSYLQSLGFTNVNAEAQKVKVDAFPDDNSYYSPNTDMISMGTGGVDDAEDPEVTWHEYGHAIQDDQVPGFGRSEEAGSIGEGFGDFMAVMMSQQTGPRSKLTPTTCVMDWDATSYTSGPKHCLRTTNTHKMYPGDLTGEVHADGEIWSNALWTMDRHLGRDKATKIIIEAQFSFNPSITMPAAARLTVSTARSLYGAQAAAQTRAAFAARGIL